jgi:DNA invertase Pin-like site-specific DNA recombinase
MTHARLRQFDAVVVYKLDRWGRRLVHCVTGIQELQSLGIRFVAISLGLDTDESNPTTKLLMHILASVAEFERSLIKERFSAGIKAAQVRGTRSGRPFGRPKTVVDRGRVVALRGAGASWAQIASTLAVPATVARRAYAQAQGKQIIADLGRALPKPFLQESGIGYGKQRAVAGD